MRGGKIQNATIMAFRWRADDGPTLNAGLVALCFLGNLYVCDFFFFWGGGGS